LAHTTPPPALTLVASVSGAPGVSCTALGLAALWPQRPALLVEADPSGGVLAARFSLARGPGLAELAAACRHGEPITDPALVKQYLPPRFEVVTAPGDAGETSGAVTVVAAHPDAALRPLGPVVVCDVGRLYPDSPTMRLLPAADAVVLVTDPGPEHLDHLYLRLPELLHTARPGAIGLAVAGKTRYSTAEISHQLGAPVWASLPPDRWGGAALTGRGSGRSWARTRLGQALTQLAGHLAARQISADGRRQT
jgi:hypothetical protein